MEEIMKNINESVWWIAAGIAVVSAVIVVAHRIRIGSPSQVKKVAIKELSYEWLLEEAKKMTNDLASKESFQNRLLHLSVLPNQLARDFYASQEGGILFKNMGLTEDEMTKMIILSIHDDQQHVLSCEVIIAEEFCEDYYDYIQKDRVYMKGIKIDSHAD